MSSNVPPEQTHSPDTPSADGDAAPPARLQVLCVDDSLMMRRTLEKVLGEQFEVHIAEGAEAAVALLCKSGPFAVVMSDLRMPGSDGLRLLKALRTVCPNTIRILYSGNMAVPVTIDAVNEAGVFRVLQTPFRTGSVLAAVTAAAEEYVRLEAERTLLSSAASGSVAGFTRLLERSRPNSASRTQRVIEHVRIMAASADVSTVVPIETAAALIDVGSLCTDGMPAADCGFEPGAFTCTLMRNAADIIEPIPALSDVRHILLQATIKAKDLAADTLSDRPISGQVLRIARDFEQLREDGVAVEEALAQMHSRTDVYDERLTAVLAGALLKNEEDSVPAVDVPVSEVVSGMIFAEDLMRSDGVLLVPRGQTVTTAMQDRLRYHWADVVATSTIRMILPAEACQTDDEQPVVEVDVALECAA